MHYVRLTAALAALLLAAGCTEGPTGGSGQPDQPGQPDLCDPACEQDWSCVSGTCKQLCIMDLDCMAADEVCSAGECVRSESPLCNSATSCTTPGPCGIADGASCVGAECVYPPGHEGAPCRLPGSPPGSFDGVCGNGSCVECLLPEDCTTPHGDHDECFTGRCTKGHCAYVPIPEVVCAELGCVDGFIHAERTCGAAGDCPVPDPAGTSCLGFGCLDQTTCKTTCVTNDDCAPGSNCLGDGSCQAPGELGEACSEIGACLSGYCSDGVCCDQACGNPCEVCDAIDGEAGTCHLVAAGTDPKEDCTSAADNCITDLCSGSTAACEAKPDGSDCGPCKKCNDEGACLNADDEHSECPECQWCSGGACVIQASGEDVKDECSPDTGCGSGDCDGAGACEYEAAGTRCYLCTACDASGSCDQPLADDDACGVIDCDGLDSPATCTNYNDIVTNRCEALIDCKDANSADCVSPVPYPAGTICRNNAGNDNCNHDEVCNGTAMSCPADDFTWVADRICSGGTLGDLLTIATGRSSVTAADRTACANHCDALAGATCCTIYGSPAVPPYFPDPFIWCYPYTGGTSLTTNTTNDYWSAICR